MTLLQALIGAALLYGAVCLLAWRLQERFVFFPDPHLVATPDRVGLAYRDIVMATEDGLNLHGWLVPAPDARWTVLFCHGNAGNISHRLDTARLFNALGLTVLFFDYRGYGHSAGKPSEPGLYADARAAWRHLVNEEGLAPQRILIWGRSLGGAVAVALAAEETPAALVVESTFSSAADVAARAYPWLPVRALLRLRFDAAGLAAGIRCPKLFVHSPQDDVIPFALGRRLYEAAAPPKEFLEIRGGHNDGFLSSGDLYTEGVRGFLAELARRPSGSHPAEP